MLALIGISVVWLVRGWQRYPVEPVLLHLNSHQLTLAAYLSRSMETNVIESRKWRERKELAGYIFACCIALVPSSPLLVDFAVQSLLAVSLCQLASTEGGSSWEYGHAWHQPRILRKNLGRRSWRRLLMLLDIFLSFTLPHCTLLNTCSVRLLDCLG